MTHLLPFLAPILKGWLFRKAVEEAAPVLAHGVLARFTHKEIDMEKRFWESKKFWAMVAGIMVPILNKATGLDLGIEETGAIMAMIATYVVGQGMADLGKNKG